MSAEMREWITRTLWDEDHRVPSKGESAWARYQRLADALLNEDSAITAALGAAGACTCIDEPRRDCPRHGVTPPPH